VTSKQSSKPALQSNYSNDTKYTSVISNGNNYLITQKQIQDFMKHYIKDEKDYANPYVAPLLAKHLFGLPKTLIIVNEFDPLRDEGIAYAKKLRWHLVWSEYYVFEGAMHGFLTNILDRKYTKMAYLKIKEFIK
jgi:acetyl esterase